PTASPPSSPPFPYTTLFRSELLLLAGHLDVGRVQHERGDAARPGRVRIGAREEDERAGVRAVRDPLLGAGDAPAVRLLHRCGAQDRKSTRLNSSHLGISYAV